MSGSDDNFPDEMMVSNGKEVAREAGGNGKVGDRRERKPLSTLATNIVPVARLGKRGPLSGKNEVADKKANVLGHAPPVARKLHALQMAEKQKQTVVKHAEATLEEKDQMITEVEMEEDDKDDEEFVMDIDSADKNNPLAVVEYIDDLYASYKKLESSSCVPPNYMMQQLDINERMRGILIDWLIEVHYKFELMEETLYLTVNLIDRFLAVQEVARKNLQLVGVTAMLLASKYEDIYVPVVKDLIMISDEAYTRKEILDMERSIAFSLQYYLSTPTPYVFMLRFLKAAQADLKLEVLSFFMVELCLVEYEMLEFPPSLLAAAAVFTAQAALTGTKYWCKTCENHTNYSQDQLLKCSRMMVKFHLEAGTGKLTGVYRKYNTSKYGFAAKTTPAVFLLEP